MSAGARAAVAFVAGALTMIAFESWPLLAAGLLVMLAGVVQAIFAIATPEFVAGDSESDQSD